MNFESEPLKKKFGKVLVAILRPWPSSDGPIFWGSAESKGPVKG